MLLNKSKYEHLNFWSSEIAAGPYDRSIINGFQTAVQAGPLCHEPMHGVCFVMQEFNVEAACEKNDVSISGIIITAVKEACRLAFQKQAQRLVGPMYHLSVTANADVLGKSNDCFFIEFLFFGIKGRFVNYVTLWHNLRNTPIANKKRQFSTTPTNTDNKFLVKNNQKKES